MNGTYSDYRQRVKDAAVARLDGHGGVASTGLVVLDRQRCEMLGHDRIVHGRIGLAA